MTAMSAPLALKDNSSDNFVGNEAGCEPASLFFRTTSMIVNLTAFFTQNPVC